MYARTLAIFTFVFASASATAAQYAPGSEVSLQGTVSGFQSARSFWVDVEGERVLVYGTAAQRARLYRGQIVRVEGSISDDYIKLADVELQARRVELIRSSTRTTAAMP